MNTTASESTATCTDGASNQPARESNINALVSFFKSGIKPEESHGKLGIELEHIIVEEDGTPVSYSEEHGVAWLLDTLSADYPNKTTDDDGDLLGVARPGEAVTIEPAAQIELSAGPYDDLSCAYKTFEDFQKKVSEVLSPHGKHLVSYGYHPTAAARTLELIPKQRYEYMNEYLGKKDIYGPCMMRGSASTQISIDYTSEHDCLRKMRIAYALVPLLSLMCDNSPIFEGTPRSHKLIRTDIWRHVDNDRCGLVPGVLDEGFSLRDYAAFVLDTPAIVVPNGPGAWSYSEKSFGELYACSTMAQHDVEHAVSMQFPDVRLKTYLEIRPADAMPVPYVIAYAALIKGLFYNETSLQRLESLFCNVDEKSFEAAKDELMQHGYDAVVYGRKVSLLCDDVISTALEALSADDAALLAPLANLVHERVTLADLAEQNSLRK